MKTKGQMPVMKMKKKGQMHVMKKKGRTPVMKMTKKKGQMPVMKKRGQMPVMKKKKGQMHVMKKKGKKKKPEDEELLMKREYLTSIGVDPDTVDLSTPIGVRGFPCRWRYLPLA